LFAKNGKRYPKRFVKMLGLLLEFTFEVGNIEALQWASIGTQVVSRSNHEGALMGAVPQKKIATST
jgi:hypothetical protein